MKVSDRVSRVVLVSAWLIVVAITAAVTAAATTPTKGQLTGPYTYTNASGARQYWLYLPSSYDGRPMPLITELHGCNPDNAVTEAQWSRVDQLAERLGFLVVYPQQDPAANGSGCWNWFEPADTTRVPGPPLNPTTQPCNCSSTGEPSMIAGITQTVMQQFSVDRRRVYVGGISAGGAMSNIMAVTYPDLFAAAMIDAGCDYMGTATCLGSVSAIPGDVSGQKAYSEMVANRGLGVVPRAVPVLVIQGTADPVVPFPNSTQILHQFVALDALVRGGAPSPIPPSASSSTTIMATPPSQSYIIEEYRDAAGCQLAERWIINGMAHQWSGATPAPGSVTDTIFNDPYGPDVTAPIYRFFLSHPMPPAGGACYQVPANAASGPAPRPI